jgi:hypothetical protein
MGIEKYRLFLIERELPPPYHPILPNLLQGLISLKVADRKHAPLAMKSVPSVAAEACKGAVNSSWSLPI